MVGGTVYTILIALHAAARGGGVRGGLRGAGAARPSRAPGRLVDL
jgi:hypothetical protein